MCHANAGVINASSDPSLQIFVLNIYEDMDVSLDPGLNEQGGGWEGRGSRCSVFTQ